eukprot:s3492_g7.t1
MWHILLDPATWKWIGFLWNCSLARNSSPVRVKRFAGLAGPDVDDRFWTEWKNFGDRRWLKPSDLIALNRHFPDSTLETESQHIIFPALHPRILELLVESSQ